MQPNGHGEVQSDPLSWADTAFLNLEGKGISRSAASVGVCAGETPWQNCLRVGGARLPIISEHRKQVVGFRASE